MLAWSQQGRKSTRYEVQQRMKSTRYEVNKVWSQQGMKSTRYDEVDEVWWSQQGVMRSTRCDEVNKVWRQQGMKSTRYEGNKVWSQQGMKSTRYEVNKVWWGQWGVMRSTRYEVNKVWWGRWGVVRSTRYDDGDISWWHQQTWRRWWKRWRTGMMRVMSSEKTDGQMHVTTAMGLCGEDTVAVNLWPRRPKQQAKQRQWWEWEEWKEWNSRSHWSLLLQNPARQASNSPTFSLHIRHCKAFRVPSIHQQCKVFWRKRKKERRKDSEEWGKEQIFVLAASGTPAHNCCQAASGFSCIGASFSSDFQCSDRWLSWQMAEL